MLFPLCENLFLSVLYTQFFSADGEVSIWFAGALGHSGCAAATQEEGAESKDVDSDDERVISAHGCGYSMEMSTICNV